MTSRDSAVLPASALPVTIQPKTENRPNVFNYVKDIKVVFKKSGSRTDVGEL